jgi:ABC-type cobalamin/Fe3+-siderophores transport system ATPase subunit
MDRTTSQLIDLSTVQRCTVVLPLILEHSDRILVVDQPEDHIDNAFIVDTLIKSILRRSTSSQVILSTHNANIPVLGEAQLVVQLASDGRRG